jgi:hypothetical protein
VVLLSFVVAGAKALDNRPLPATPLYDQPRHAWDGGYDEIRDVNHDGKGTTSSDGYEIPVTQDDDDEDEVIYDVARPEVTPEERPASMRKNTYMNDSSSSTHM